MIRRVRTLLRTPESISMSANVMSAGFSLLTFLLLTRSFGPDALGLWFVFLSGATLADMFRIGLVNKGFVYHYSGSNSDRDTVAGSGILLFTLVSFILAAAIMTAPLLLPGLTADGSSWRLFFHWYPLFALASIPHNIAEWIAQARLNFQRTVITRLIVRGGLAAVAGLSMTAHGSSVDDLALMFIGLNAVASLWTVTAGWTPLKSIRHSTGAMVSELFRFGKFNALTQSGANLLRSSDTFLLGSLSGPVSVARYGVPAKLLEVVELPLRSFGAALYPELSRLHQQNDLQGMQRLFLRNVVRVTAAVFPFVMVCAVFAEPVILLLGGEQYRDTVPILYLFLAYCLLIPFDRFSGILMDSLNQPHYNMVKVWTMLAVNISADIAALLMFGTAESVAAASLITYGAGTAMNVIMIRSVTGWSLSSLRASVRKDHRNGQ